LRATINAAIIALPRHRILILIVGRLSSSLSRYTLLEEDARLIEIAYQQRLLEIASPSAEFTDNTAQAEVPLRSPSEDPTVGLAFPKELLRKRSKTHLSFVRGQPCLICKKTPSDPHHLKFAQARTLGRKVSDEFTVPLCRSHHQDLHRYGNEKGWWTNMQIEPLDVAKQLWEASQILGKEDSAMAANASHKMRTDSLELHEQGELAVRLPLRRSSA
jgi:hypothetical protein